MSAARASIPARIGMSAAFLAFVAAHCAIYSPYGIDNNDSLYILGLAQDFFLGGEIYEDVVYLKPPLPVILHSIYFHPPFDEAPVLFSRIVPYLQIAAYSALTGLLFARWFDIRPGGTFLLVLASFIFDAHNFPPMPWHTIDGIFFSVIAVAVAATSTRGNIGLKAFVAFLFAYLAALSKQPFYVTPLLIAVLMVLPWSTRRALLTIVAAIAAAAVVFGSLAMVVDLQKMTAAIASPTSFRELISSGLIDYARDWHDIRVVVCVGPLTLALLLWAYGRARGARLLPEGVIQGIFVLGIAIYLASLAYVFSRAEGRVFPSGLTDTIFTVTGLISLVMAALTRDRAWLALLAMHGIAWASSISWGYTSVALFVAPCVVVIAVALRDVFAKRRLAYPAAAAAVLFSAYVYFLGSTYLYSHEAQFLRAAATVPLGDEFPAMAGIFVTEQRASEFRELADLRERLGTNLATAPNWPAYSVAFQEQTATGAGWFINGEIGPFTAEVIERLGDVDYALVYRDALRFPADHQRFGSSITEWIETSWQPLPGEGHNFEVYKNPSQPQYD